MLSPLCTISHTFSNRVLFSLTHTHTLTHTLSLCVTQGDLAFGKKGRPSSAGKPRIPADATIVFDVEIVGLPGKEPELIDIIGDV